VTIPLRAANRYVLPEICLVTGQRRSVEWRRVRLRWLPAGTWLAYVLVLCLPGILRLLGLLVAIGIQIAASRSAVVELPFVRGTFGVWRVGRSLLPLALLIGLCGGGLVGLSLLLTDDVVAGLVVGGGGLLLPLCLWLALVRGRGPGVDEILGDRVILNLPDETAALEFRRVLSGQPPPGTPLAGATCTEHPQEAAALACVRCGRFACEQCRRPDLPPPMCVDCGAERDAHVSRERLTEGPPVPLRPPSELTCVRHPETPVTTRCTVCEKPRCEACVVERPGTRLPVCRDCLAEEAAAPS